MLAIRLQRIGRSGHAQFRLIVQDKRFSPKSGRVTAYLGSYDPHTKTAVIDKEKAAEYLKNGAQPSERAAKLLKSEGVKLPAWVKIEKKTTKRDIRNPEKLRRNRSQDAEPVEAPAEAPAEAPVPAAAAPEVEESEETPSEVAPDTTPEAPAEKPTEEPVEETKPEEKPGDAEENPAEVAAADKEPKPEA